MAYLDKLFGTGTITGTFTYIQYLILYIQHSTATKDCHRTSGFNILRSVCPYYIWWKWLRSWGKSRAENCDMICNYQSIQKFKQSLSPMYSAVSYTKPLPCISEVSALIGVCYVFIDYFHWSKNSLHHDIFILTVLKSHITFPICHHQCY